MKIKHIIFILLFLMNALFSTAQQSFFRGNNKYVVPVIPFQAPPITSGEVTNGLILYLNANNTASYPGGGNIWYDLSSSANNIIFYNNGNYTTTTSPSYSTDGGGCLVINGQSIFGRSINNSSISGSSPRTFSAWVKFNSTQNTVVATIGGASNYTLFEMMQFNNNIINHIWGTYLPGTTPIATNAWYNIAIVYDGTNHYYVYLNGNQDGGPNMPGYSGILNTVNSPIYIGTSVGPTTWGSFNGSIALLSLYNRALTPSEISTNFNALKSRFGL